MRTCSLCCTLGLLILAVKSERPQSPGRRGGWKLEKQTTQVSLFSQPPKVDDTRGKHQKESSSDTPSAQPASVHRSLQRIDSLCLHSMCQQPRIDYILQ